MGTPTPLSLTPSNTPESLSEHLRTVPGWRTLRYQAVVDPVDIYHPTAERLWKAWERLYCDTTLNDEEREENANAFYEGSSR